MGSWNGSFEWRVDTITKWFILAGLVFSLGMMAAAWLTPSIKVSLPKTNSTIKCISLPSGQTLYDGDLIGRPLWASKTFDLMFNNSEGTTAIYVVGEVVCVFTRHMVK